MTESDRTTESEYRIRLVLEERPPGASGWYPSPHSGPEPCRVRTTELIGWTKQQALQGYDQLEALLDSDFIEDLVKSEAEWAEAQRDHEAHMAGQDPLDVDQADETTSLESNHS